MTETVGLHRLPGITFRQLGYFAAIAHAGTITQAARTMRVSESSLSHALSELERQLDAVLCVRRRSVGITLTPEGRTVLEYATELLGRASALEAEMGRASIELPTTLTVACVQELAAIVLPRILARVARMHPEIDVVTEIATESSIWSRLRSHRVDFAVGLDIDFPRAASSIVMVPLLARVVLPRGHALAAHRELGIDDLRGLPFVHTDSEPVLEVVRAHLGDGVPLPRVAARASTMEMARSLVASGVGFALEIGHRQLDAPEGTRGVEVRLLRTVNSESSRSAVLAWSPTRTPGRCDEVFLHAAREAWRPLDVASQRVRQVAVPARHTSLGEAPHTRTPLDDIA
ncbi:LysR family transcriptional regulator [Herbiconiux sp. A18JL235]|uniref:LysR family transcriptional regulator n=1 Tax=Herbiconiux sp. A18JL235 TaxID=3152363 RepID=A0AB39BJ45_9MICO